MLRGQATKEDCDVIPLGCREWSLDRTTELLARLLRLHTREQPETFGLNALTDVLLDGFARAQRN